MPSEDVTHFTTVDQTANPDFFLRFIEEANKQPAAIRWKPTIVEALRLQPGMRVLDVGCGLGNDAFELAAVVGPGGSVTGVDFSETLIAEAIKRAADRECHVTFEVGDAQALRFPSSSFDAVRAERVLMHVPDVSRALAEMPRVLRPGGRMTVLDFDWETQFCDSPYKHTTRKIAVSFCDGMKNGWIGRSLPRLFREAGLSDISVSFDTAMISHDFFQFLLGGHVARAVANGILSQAEADRWWTDLARANAQGRFLCGMTAFIVTGTKM
jgi:ubiquinone/menaquinone biosynthesis C-methylase UbiE